LSFKKIIVEKEDGVAKITLNRPEVLNALDGGVINELKTAIKDVSKDKDVRAVVITGAGRGFCSGVDLASSASVIAGLTEIHEVIKGITNMEKPVIALINGVAVGGGLDLAMACDIRIASEKAKLSEIFVKRGLLPDMGGTYFLPRLVGLGKAKELIFTGEIIDAREAKRIGLVNKVVPHEELNSTGMELARKLAKGPTLAIGKAKIAINTEMGLNLDSALKDAIEAGIFIFGTEDALEGIMAFVEKREPKFKCK
jgi:enoyl-CoA hydratase/carnithine racemase